jgi:hypothetical protein
MPDWIMEKYASDRPTFKENSEEEEGGCPKFLGACLQSIDVAHD